MRRDVFQAIADPVRREIIDLLSQESMTVQSIAERFDISRPAISKHLKILRECGLVDLQQHGRENYYHIDPAQLVPAFMWLEQYQKLWEDKIDSFEEYLIKLKTERNNE